MEINNLISSGIIEMYCLGISSTAEKNLVEKLAAENKDVRFEIAAVNEALIAYAIASGKAPAESLKSKIMDAIAGTVSTDQQIQFPPRISLNSRSEDWFRYLADNSIVPPEDYDQFHLFDLPGNEKQATYIAWAKKGAVVEESHADEDEYLLMLKGNCSVTIDSRLGYYKEGDIVFIPKGAVHRTEALSAEPMLIIGQRIAA